MKEQVREQYPGAEQSVSACGFPLGLASRYKENCSLYIPVLNSYLKEIVRVRSSGALRTSIGEL